MLKFEKVKEILNRSKHQNNTNNLDFLHDYVQNTDKIVDDFIREEYFSDIKFKNTNTVPQHSLKKKNVEKSNNFKDDSLTNFLPESCYYLKSNNFISSMLVLNTPSFYLLSKNCKQKEINKLKEQLFINLDSYYKQLSYKKKGFKKGEMQNILTNEKPLDNAIKNYLCDFHEVNIIILDTNNNTYEEINEYNSEYDNSLLIKQTRGFNVVLNNNENNIENLHSIMEEKFKKIYTFSKGLKHNWNKLKISELREIAEQNYIPISKNGKKKKKKKKKKSHN